MPFLMTGLQQQLLKAWQMLHRHIRRASLKSLAIIYIDILGVT